MDLTKILKVGDRIYCTLYGYVEVTTVAESYIKVEGDLVSLFLDSNGRGSKAGECVIFPSKDNRDWNTITKFKNGDVIISDAGIIAIFSHVGTVGNRNDVVFYHCILPPIGSLKVITDCGIGHVNDCSLASDKQKERIFKALKANSYKWNDEIGAIEKVESFKPFDKVLVRDNNRDKWRCGFFSHLDENYCVSSFYWHQCIPYNEETQHLVGTNQDCPDKYKIW